MRQLSRPHLSAIAILAAATPALAHGGYTHPSDRFPWTWDIWITAPLVLTLFLYLRGWRRLRSRSSQQRQDLRLRAAAFGAGWGLLAVALVSPIHAAGERSFLAHMVEHEILMLAATPLLVLAEPLPVLLWAFPPDGRRFLGRAGAALGSSGPWRSLCGPVGATALQAAALWLWHAPTLFNRALESDAWHMAQHLSFVVGALIFWNAMLGRRGAHAGAKGAQALAALCLFVTSLIGGALGALMAFAESPWYSAYTQRGMPPFGLTAAEDQQLAGLVMWVPGGLVHLGAMLLVMRHLLKPASVRGIRDAV